MAANTTSTMSSNLHLYYEKRLLDRLTKKLVIEPLGYRSVNIPRGLGKQAKWLRYDERHVTSTSSYLLTEGVTPTDIAITSRNITATVNQYGNVTYISDLLEFTAIDPVLENVSDVMGDEAAELVDTLCRDELDSNLPNQFAGGAANLAATGSGQVMTAKEGLKAMITLKKNSVGPHESGSYVCVVHPASLGDLMNDTNAGSWVDINKYMSNSTVKNGEAGMAYGVKYMVSENISSTTSGTLGGATVYSNLFLGKGCFGTVELGKGGVKMSIKRAGESGIADPLDQINAVSWKIMGFVPKYLGGSSNGTADRGLRIRAGSGF